MTIHHPIALVVCIVGLVLYLLPTAIGGGEGKPPRITISGKVNEIGRIMFWVGLLVELARVGGQHWP